VPALAGQPAAQLVEKLKAFQRGERPSTIMQQIAKGYSDAQIDALARWFAGQQP
jgi:cytochrome c553